MFRAFLKIRSSAGAATVAVGAVSIFVAANELNGASESLISPANSRNFGSAKIWTPIVRNLVAYADDHATQPRQELLRAKFLTSEVRIAIN